MAGITVTTKVTTLQTLFNTVDEIYFKKGELKSTDLAAAITVDMELPVSEDGVTFNTGEAEVTTIKLTNGSIWSSKAKKGDADISFNVPSIAVELNELLLNKKTNISETSTLVDGETYEGGAYSLAPKKIVGSLLMMSQDKESVIALCNVEIYSSFTAADGDNPAYFKLKVTPLENSEGADIFILWRKEA